MSAQTLIDYWFLNDSRIEKAVLEAVAGLRSTGDRVYLLTTKNICGRLSSNVGKRLARRAGRGC